MHLTVRRPALALAASCLLAAALFGTNEWLMQLYSHDEPGLVVAVLMGFVLPLATTIIPVAALVWLIVSATSRWHRGSLLGVSLFLLPTGAMLFVLGGWLQSLYGLDPPYGFFFLGWGLQTVALMTPLALVAWAATSIIRRRRASA
jgi:hypothetical protein